MVAQKNLCVLILAAGKGTRMKSSLPKPLHPVCGLPMLAHSLRAAQTLNPDGICVVIGHQATFVEQEINKHLADWGITAPVACAEQKELTGSGSAVRAAVSYFKNFTTILILNGDVPMIRPETLVDMKAAFNKAEAGALVLGITVPNPHGYGRIVREADCSFARIVEETDADEQTRRIAEVNSGMYVFDAATLISALARLKPQGPKQEFYLTDTLALIKETGRPVLVFNTTDYEQALGVNGRADLAMVETIMCNQINKKHLDNGVRLVRPDLSYIEEAVQIGQDTVIDPNCHLQGNTVIGKNCLLESGVYIKDCQIGDNVIIKANSYLESSTVENECEIGPMAHLRPKSVLKTKSKVGNFSETKNAIIGEGSKVNHLSYIGDTDMGSGVNIGAGTITCNYDGQKKHRTVIGEHCFIGSNVNFVAPVEVKPYSKIGAGSTITKEVPEGSLAIARARQVVLENKGIKKHD